MPVDGMEATQSGCTLPLGRDDRFAFGGVPEALRVLEGRPFPLGATCDDGGVNFALFSQHATGVRLVLFDVDGTSRDIPLLTRSGPIWHGYVCGLRPGQLYGYRIEGPYRPKMGHLFNANKVLLDPYARAIGRPLTWDPSLYGFDRSMEEHPMDTLDNASFAPLGVVVSGEFDWDNDRSLEIPWRETVIYEAHVRGLTMLHPDVPNELRGTFLGLASEPVLQHLKDLGVTSVELLPVHACVQDERLVQEGLAQYWGYNTLSFFAPEPRYAVHDAVSEFKTMVRALHKHGFEVLLDVVYNHTGEGNHLGPTLSLRGIDNRAYYKGTLDNVHLLEDVTGCGNTLDASEPAVLQLIMDSLRYWVSEMHVDGFRFDLASALARRGEEVEMRGPMLQAIAQDPVLSRVKLIAEPWDLGPRGYQLGRFPWPWSEWNDKYRDAVRRFWRADDAMAGEFATRLAGSSDLFHRRGPTASINFVTVHDGFTLSDLVSYERKHNQANGEHNRDGTDTNYSTNCGVEGPSSNPDVCRCRDRLRRCMLASLMTSQGVPMLLGGDELSRTQGGNNNAYCQDNETSWVHWEVSDGDKRFLAFVQKTVALRKAHSGLRRSRFMTGESDTDGQRDIIWWHPEGREMSTTDWMDAACRTFGLLLPSEGVSEGCDETLLILFNAGSEPVRYRLPEGPHVWNVALCTSDRDVPVPDSEVLIEPVEVLILRAV